MSKKPILYYFALDPPSRAVLLAAAELCIDLELKIINLLELEHKTEEFIKINPLRTIPTLVDCGIVVTDSHAICAYLSEKYGASDRLYPKDLVKRSLVDSRMHFDSSHVLARSSFLFEPIFFNKSKEMPEDRIKSIQTVWDIMERFFDNSTYVCGDEITIADFCLIASVSSVNKIIQMDPDKHSKLIKWIELMSQLPYYEECNGKDAIDLQKAVIKKQKENLAT